MGRQLFPGQIENSRQIVQRQLEYVTGLAKQVQSQLEHIYNNQNTRNPFHPGISVHLHDEEATAHELVRMLERVNIHILTDEELADAGYEVIRK